MTTIEIRNQIDAYIDRLSPERLLFVADFLAYLADRESQEATEELLRIPNFYESMLRAESEISIGNYQNWRDIHRDV